MSLAPITTHVTDAIARLPQQYKGKAMLQGLLTALVTQVQLLDDQGINLATQRSVSTAVGTQLDKLGTIVGISRANLSDEAYRLRIQARILINISTGTPEGLIQVFKLLTLASNVVLNEQFPADVALYTDGDIDPTQITFVQQSLELAAPAGVRVAFMGHFDPVLPFACDGTLVPEGGFGDATDPTQGGVLGSLYLIGPQFALDGDDPAAGGFSSLNDPVEGGYFSV